MFILTQNKELLVPFTEKDCIKLSEVGLVQSSRTITGYAISIKDKYQLGAYSTKEQALMVMEDITEALRREHGSYEMEEDEGKDHGKNDGTLRKLRSGER